MTRLLVATTNRDKIVEIRHILAGLDVELVGLDRWPSFAPPEETGATFDENARAKALYYAAVTGMAAVAEDSGLEIDELDKAPGVHSARFGGETASYPEKFALIYRMLAERHVATSAARFVCALAVADQAHVVFETRGTVEGLIAAEPCGTGGFGYDPIFFYPPFNRTLAEVSRDEKATVSHRGRAFGQLAAHIRRGGPAAKS